MTLTSAQNGVKRGGMTKTTKVTRRRRMTSATIMTGMIFLLAVSLGCAHCKPGQVDFKGHCFYPGHVYETTLAGDVIP